MTWIAYVQPYPNFADIIDNICPNSDDMQLETFLFFKIYKFIKTSLHKLYVNYGNPTPPMNSLNAPKG